MTKDQALIMAIEAMKITDEAFTEFSKGLVVLGIPASILRLDKQSRLIPAIQACKEALAQPAQEPINLKCKSLQKRLATQWISVEDKLPEFVTINNYEKASNDILILIDNKHIYVGAYIFDVWSKTDDFCMRDLDGGYEVVDDMKITHWMPLPDAPKESNDD